MSNFLRLSGVTLPGSGYPSLRSFLDVTPALPVANGLLGLYYLRDSGGRETKNYVAGGQPLIKVGSPVVLEHGAICNKDNYYDMGFKAQPAGTILAIAKPGTAPTTLANSIPVVSGFVSVADTYGKGDSLYFGTNFSGAGSFIASAASDQAIPASQQVGRTLALPVAEPVLVFGTFVGGAPRFIVGNLANDALAKATYALAASNIQRPAAPFGNNLRIGSSRDGFSGESNVSLVAYFNRVLTDAEILQNLMYLRHEWGVAMGVW